MTALTAAEKERLTCDCGVMEDDPTWPETFCPFHAGRMDLEVSGSADALLTIVEAILAARTAALEAERDRLQRWKDEALPVLDGLQEIGKALNLPLGTQITGPQALEAIEALQAERDRLAAAVERVEALADGAAYAGRHINGYSYVLVTELRVALSDAGQVPGLALDRHEDGGR